LFKFTPLAAAQNLRYIIHIQLPAGKSMGQVTWGCAL
jgi:hypothetical protein